MAKRGQAGQTLTARRWFTASFALALGLAPVLVTGCSTTPTASAQPHDPLHGVLTPPTIPQPTYAPKTPGTSTSFPGGNKQSSAPLGSDLSSTNNATLAGLSGGPLGRPLAIDDQGRPQPGIWTPTSGTQQTPVNPAFPAYNPKPRVEKIPDIQPTQSKFTPSTWETPQPTTTSITPATTEALTRQLQERGVINQKVDRVANGVELTCYVSRGPSGGLRVLEATASDYARAAEAILRQLDGR